MALSKETSLYNRQAWEDSDFPILCETCLGNNPFLRMMKDVYGNECKICNRPFSTFRWCPGHKMRYKKTEVCQTCAKAKNVCQTCLLDLKFGLPVQVLNSTSDSAQSDNLVKLARNSPYYKRNQPHICSFWVKGECKRGEECPYRHEKPSDPEDPLSKQNIKDRYYGSNDPVAEKLLKRVAEMPKPIAPEDKFVTTLYLGSTEGLTEEAIKDYFIDFGDIRTVAVKRNCAFVTFVKRESAEAAIEKVFRKCVIDGHKVIVKWGKPQARRNVNVDGDEERPPVKLIPIPGFPTPSTSSAPH